MCILNEMHSGSAHLGRVLDPFVLDHRRFESVTRIGDLVDQPFL
jgi:hypothetical protein